jgi:hypothetical protein
MWKHIIAWKRSKVNKVYVGISWNYSQYKNQRPVPELHCTLSVHLSSQIKYNSMLTMYSNMKEGWTEVSN